MKATQKKLEQVAGKYDAEIKYDFAASSVAAFAPNGTVWADSGCPLIEWVCHSSRSGGQSWKADAYSELIEAMECGLLEG